MNVGLILNMEPQNCLDCDYRSDHYCDIRVDDHWIPDDESMNPNDHRPDWCPLQEVEPARHGKWEYDLDGFYICTVCGNKERVAEKIGVPIWEYCPWCGAKMEGEKYD